MSGTILPFNPKTLEPLNCLEIDLAAKRVDARDLDADVIAQAKLFAVAVVKTIQEWLQGNHGNV